MIDDDAVMRLHPLRVLTVAVAVLALALPATGLAGARGTTDRGVVQAIDGSHIVLRALDGSAVAFVVFPGTRVKVNGERASLSDITAGLVAEVAADAKGRAVVIRAFGHGGATTT